MKREEQHLHKSLGTWHVFAAGIALVVAASTLVTDFQGYIALGWGFAIALLVAFAINLTLGISVAELSVSYPRAGALYSYAQQIIKGPGGRLVGVFLGLTFFGLFALAVSGETAAGAFALQSLLGSGGDVRVYIVILTVLALIPNLIGIKEAAWVSAILLIFMLGIRLAFGLAGFAGLADTGGWAASNLTPEVGVASLFGDGGILVVGLALAFWSFVGIEFACSLAEEVEVPKKSMPLGIIAGLVAILLTSWIMGVGSIGTLPIADWAVIAESEVACSGQCPQLAIGQAMFGTTGLTLMALASASATLGTLVVSFAAMPRLIYAMARDNMFFGPMSKSLGQLHEKRGTPVNATILTGIIYVIPALWSADVVDWLFSAAYVWILIYVVYHVLAIIKRKTDPTAEKAFDGNWFVPVAVLGIVLSLVGLYYAFLGAHGYFGKRALIIMAVALGLAAVSYVLRDKENS